MADDKYAAIRALPFPVVAQALGIDISKYRLRKDGTEYSGPCAIHNPKKNSSSFSYADNGTWHCFSCNAKGKGAIDFCKAVRQLGFQAAVELLEPYSNTRPPAPVASKEPVTENPPFKSSYEKFFKPHTWLAERGLLPETLQRYGVGFYQNDTRKSAYNGSVMLRIARYSDGETVGYLVRNIGEITPDKPKYRFPEGLAKSLELWGAYQLKDKAPIRILYVTESPFAAMHFHQLGLPAVALMGWSVSPQQLEILTKLAKGIVFLPDKDKYEEAKPYAALLATKLWTRYPVMPKTDPELLSKEEILNLT